MNEEVLLKYGWRPIVSDLQANALLRRALKHGAKLQQSKRDHQLDCGVMISHLDCVNLLSIKKGNWYKFIKNPVNDCRYILIWPR